MLHIYYGDMPEAVFNTAVYFKNVYEDAWINDPTSKEKNVDGAPSVEKILIRK